MQRVLCYSVIVALTLLHSEGKYANAAAVDAEVNRERESFLLKAVGALDRLVWYLQEHYHEGNLDLFIGTRIAEGQLRTLLDNGKFRASSSDFIWPQSLILRVENIHKDLRFVGDRGAALTELNEPLYFKSIGGIIESHVRGILTMGFLRIFPDAIMLFLLEIGTKVGCLDELKRLARQSDTTITAEADRICANVYAQAKQIEEADFPHGKRDIFMEQIALCGMLGYSNFFQTAWLDRILTWQKPAGCYGYYVAGSKQNGPDESSSPAAPPAARSRSNRIVKREEKRMKDGCSSHRTAVAGCRTGSSC
ncbi:hypothetical protein BV898_10146 [Hypsibius exemplaris]|uniref:Uncharacterized protein n=1 Tax=Hypsibius exemplaris TaxID=2072580 RepID=A0A1W0WKD4_HYPEX|nr:hypothetical protein BV898_10146 [Hypsibius exemplaris]